MKNLGGSIGWGADCEISMPEPLPSDRVVYVDMDAFGFTLQGIAHNMRGPDLEYYSIPVYSPAPQGLAGGEIS
jgi:hypothetical protein